MSGKSIWLRTILGMLMTLIIGMLLSGCSSSSSIQPPGPDPASVPGPKDSVQMAAWISDGMVATDEYSQSQKFGNMEVFTRLGDGVVYIAIRSPREGYLSLGIRPEQKMQGGDIITCTVTGSQAKIYDTYAIGTFGPHPEDTTQGGSDDILEASGTRTNGVTTFEFKRRLDTGDKRDKALVEGDNPIMWAIGPSPDISARHSSRGTGTLIIK